MYKILFFFCISSSSPSPWCKHLSWVFPTCVLIQYFTPFHYIYLTANYSNILHYTHDKHLKYFKLARLKLASNVFTCVSFRLGVSCLVSGACIVTFYAQKSILIHMNTSQKSMVKDIFKTCTIKCNLREPCFTVMFTNSNIKWLTEVNKWLT